MSLCHFVSEAELVLLYGCNKKFKRCLYWTFDDTTWWRKEGLKVSSVGKQLFCVWCHMSITILRRTELLEITHSIPLVCVICAEIPVIVIRIRLNDADCVSTCDHYKSLERRVRSLWLVMIWYRVASNDLMLWNIPSFLNIFALTAIDFKFGMHFGFSKAHHKITPREKSGRGPGLGDCLHWAKTVIYWQAVIGCNV